MLNTEAIAGREEQFVLTRTAEQHRQVSDGDNDWVTPEIKYFEGRTDEAPAQEDNKDL